MKSKEQSNTGLVSEFLAGFVDRTKYYAKHRYLAIPLLFLLVGLTTSCAEAREPMAPTAQNLGPTATETMMVPPTETPTPIPTLTAMPTLTETPSGIFSSTDLLTMSDEEKLSAVPEIEGYTKTVMNKTYVTYLNAEGKAEKAHDLVTGELLEIFPISTESKRPFEISLEDLTSGKLADSERVQCEPFSEKAKAPEWKLDGIQGSFKSVEISMDTSYRDTEARGEKICSFSTLKIDLGRGLRDYTIIGLQIKNPDGTVSFTHTPMRPEDVNLLITSIDQYSFGVMTTLEEKYPNYPETEAVMAMFPEVAKLGRELLETGVVPVGIERILINISGTVWSP